MPHNDHHNDMFSPQDDFNNPGDFHQHVHHHSPKDEPQIFFFPLNMEAQPNDVTCGPTSLHAVYHYFGDSISLDEVINSITQLNDGGGTLSPILACHALRRGYKATLFTFDLKTFDPTWFALPKHEMPKKLKAQMEAKQDPKIRFVSQAYLDFLALGGNLRFEDLTRAMIRRLLNRKVPILVGLSSTYLYREIREVPSTSEDDDIRGMPAGHFVVLHGYNKIRRTVSVADPYSGNPLGDEVAYSVSIDRVICAILLGIVTYDANLLIIEPQKQRDKRIW